MSDDLKSRLRSVGGVRHDGATRWYINPDGPEAADYIEKLETALREITVSARLVGDYYHVKIAHKALEGKDG